MMRWIRSFALGMAWNAARIAALAPVVSACGADGKFSPYPASDPAQAGLPLDFERGPGPQGTESWWSCTQPFFDGKKPSGATCDAPGVDANGCSGELFCEGCSNFGVCLDYLGAPDAPFAGDYSLRIDEESADDPGACSNIGDQADGFGGVKLWLGHDDVAHDDLCPAEVAPRDLSGVRALSFMLRIWEDGPFDAEIALREVGGRETDRGGTFPSTGKLLASEFTDGGYLPQGVWTKVEIPICELLQSKLDSHVEPLKRDAIVALIVGFARTHFIGAGTYVPGPHALDVDDIEFVPCASGACSCE
jgi:hypothetical protein